MITAGISFCMHIAVNHGLASSSCMLYEYTVFPRIDAAAFIYFVGQFGAATIRGRRLFEGGVYYFQQYGSATYTASSPSNCDDKQVRKSKVEKHTKQRETHKTS